MESMQEIVTILEAAERYANGVRADTRFTDSHKADLIQANFQAAREDAVQLAQTMLSTAKGEESAAQANYDKAYGEWYQKWRSEAGTSAMLAIADANAVVAMPLPAIEGALENAIRGNDYPFLHNFTQSTISQLHERTRVKGDQEFYNKPSVVKALEGRALVAMYALESTELQAARKRLALARQKEDSIASGIRRMNDRYAERTGGRGPLYVSAPTTSTETVDIETGKRRITITSDSWF